MACYPVIMDPKQVLQIVAGLVFIGLVAGHGRMIDPASRNSAWRFDFANPKEYTDNELNCGGFNVQWESNSGKCGVCGDPYNRDEPRFVYPGKYAKGIITKTYTKGQQITIKIEITSNHRGSFTFRIGDIGTPPITQEKLTHVLKQPNGAASWQMPLKSGNGVFSIDLLLPQDLTCDHCVIQWWWKTGNNWGCDGTDCGVGKGEKQETFVNCADVKISSSGRPGPHPDPPSRGPSSEAPTRPSKGTPAVTPSERPTVPTSPPRTGRCRGTEAWTGSARMDQWCRLNCARGHCPSSVCECSS